MNSRQKILYDCRKATLLVEKELLAPLSIRESVALELHLAGCSICRLYQSQTILISKMMEQILKQRKVPGLDHKFKSKLQNRIDHQQQGNKNIRKAH